MLRTVFPKTAKVTIHVGLAAKRLRATVNLGSSKKKPWLAQGWEVDHGQSLEQGWNMDQGWGVEQDFNGCEDEAAVVNTKQQGDEEFFASELLDLQVQTDSDDCFESMVDDPFLSSSTAEEITIVDQDDVEVSTLKVPTLDENDNLPNLKQVIEKEKKTRRFVSRVKSNELRLKESERMKLLEEVKKRVGNIEISKK